MKNLHNLSDLHIHFVGIGGISMSGLAKMALSLGAKVTGSDIGINQEIRELRRLGVNVFDTHATANISNDIDLIVYTAAIKMDNPELVMARALAIDTIERAEFLGWIANRYNKVIAVAGTHGKTTTTAMLGLIMQRANLNPTIHIGGQSINLQGNTIIGGQEYLLLEACEYRESFRYLNPYIGVITNIDLDHLDYYSDYNSIYKAFERFALKSTSIVCLDDIHITHTHKIEVGTDWQVKNIEYALEGFAFNVYKNGYYYDTFRINIIGIHNVTNALFAIAIADKLGIAKDIMVEALADYMGVERRYEKIAKLDNCNVIIDYAHHPTELKSSIEGICSVYGRVLYVFQPHTYTRTQKLYAGFVEVLNKLDNLIIYSTYAAREEVVPGGTALDLYNGLNCKHKIYIEDLVKIKEHIESASKDFDCIIVLGAGDLAERLKDYYKGR